MGLTAAEAATVLGCSVNHVYRMARQGRLPRSGARGTWAGFDADVVERVSLERLHRRTLVGHPWWADVAEAATVLGVSRERVRQLAAQGRVPAVRHQGRWLFRRHQLEVVANARNARKFAGAWG
jgi:excisionase family DNA binding protein